MKKMFCFCAVCIFIAGTVLVAAPAKAAVVQWTDWTSITSGELGGATGTLHGTTNTVTYTGEVFRSGWTDGNWTIGTPYTTPTGISNAPPQGNYFAGAINSIGLVGGLAGANTITFGTAVLNPVMAIQSLGSPTQWTSYVFTAPFTILSQGEGFFNTNNNSSTLSPGINVVPPGHYELAGLEGNGVIQFSGTFSSISWVVPAAETWHMFTVGVPIPAPVPLPSSILLLAPCIVGFIILRKRMGQRG
ncbi:MAG: hypothetical protein C0392_08205 [Syntrophus sp. (in: bacteria)]|nr:hypothetical protein [Syntrophus sp. (in: bacteria)]